MYFYVTKAFREAHISSSDTGSWNFQTGVIIGTFRAAFLTLKRVVLCGRCSSVSQRETGLSLEEFVQDASSFYCV